MVVVLANELESASPLQTGGNDQFSFLSRLLIDELDLFRCFLLPEAVTLSLPPCFSRSLAV